MGELTRSLLYHTSHSITIFFHTKNGILSEAQKNLQSTQNLKKVILFVFAGSDIYCEILDERPKSGLSQFCFHIYTNNPNTNKVMFELCEIPFSSGEVRDWPKWHRSRPNSRWGFFRGSLRWSLQEECKCFLSWADFRHDISQSLTFTYEKRNRR